MFALLSSLVYAVVNFIDKYLIEKKVKDFRGMPIYTAIMGGVMGAFFWLITGLTLLPLYDSLLILLSCILQIFGTALYFKATFKSETSKPTLINKLLFGVVLCVGMWRVY